MENKDFRILYPQLEKIVASLDARYDMLTHENSASSYIPKLQIYFTDIVANASEFIKNVKKNYIGGSDKFMKHRAMLKTAMSSNGYANINYPKHHNKEVPVLMGQKCDYITVVETLTTLPKQIEELNQCLKSAIKLMEEMLNSEDENRTRLRYGYDYDTDELKTATVKMIAKIIDPQNKKETAKLGKLIQNEFAGKKVSEMYLEMFDELKHSNIDETVKLVDKLFDVVTIWKDVIDSNPESRHSKYVVSSYRDTIKSLATITTNIGVLITIADQSATFYHRTISELARLS